MWKDNEQFVWNGIDWVRLGINERGEEGCNGGGNVVKSEVFHGESMYGCCVRTL